MQKYSSQAQKGCRLENKNVAVRRKNQSIQKKTGTGSNLHGQY